MRLAEGHGLHSVRVDGGASLLPRQHHAGTRVDWLIGWLADGAYAPNPNQYPPSLLANSFGLLLSFNHNVGD